MNIHKVLLLLPIIGFATSSCNNDNVTTQQNEPKTKILCSVDKFISHSLTRTSVDPSNNYAITWANGDVIGIFPREGYQEPFEIPIEQVGQSKASFDGGYWALKSGLTYNAYYPFDKANFESASSKTQIPVTYLGQEQTGTTCCSGKYDYTYSDWTTSNGSSINFKFHHIGAFYVLSLKIPATATYTSLTISTNSNIIPTTGTYDLTAQKPAFVAKTTAASLTMNLCNFSATANDVVKFYMMLPPVNLSSSTLIATLSTGTTTCTYDLPSQNIEAAHLYQVEGEPKSSEVSGTVDDWITDEHEYVDLGLSVKWATCNVGANAPEEYGNYFAWGETVGYGQNTNDGHVFCWENYKWCDGAFNSMTKYCASSTYGIKDDRTNLDSSDDAATANWGGTWRMPTEKELDELINNCNWTWSSLNGKNGYNITSKTNENHIFIPAASYRNQNNIGGLGMCLDYWTSSLYLQNSGGAYCLYAELNNCIRKDYYSRYFAMAIRPVRP